MTTPKPLRIGILDGDDIGREIVPVAVEIGRAAAKLHGVAVDWYPLPIGARALGTHGHTLPPETMSTLRHSTAGFSGRSATARTRKYLTRSTRIRS